MEEQTAKKNAYLQRRLKQVYNKLAWRIYDTSMKDVESKYRFCGNKLVFKFYKLDGQKGLPGDIENLFFNDLDKEFVLNIKEGICYSHNNAYKYEFVIKI